MNICILLGLIKKYYYKFWEETRLDRELEKSFTDILKIIKTRFYIIIVITVLVVAASGVYSFKLAKPVYEAKTRIIIGSAKDPEGTKLQISDASDYQRQLKTYCTIAKTTVVLDRAAEKLNMGITGVELGKSIIASPQTDTQFIDLSARWGEAEQASTMLNAVIEVFIEEAMNIYPGVTVKVMDKVKVPEFPVAPNKARNLIIGFMLGIMASVGLILFIEFMDSTIKTEEEAEAYLELPVLGVIPKEKEGVDKITSYSIKESHHVIMESFRTLRTNIDFIAGCNNIKSILVTSSVPGEGKSTTASMLASVMANAGKKTLLIDCDMRKAKIHKIFDVSNVVGISNVLAGKAELKGALTATEIKNLHIITAGVRPPNPSELLSSGRMKAVIDALKEQYDFIILDTSPVGVVTDAQILSQVVDGSILVISSGESQLEATIKAKGLLKAVNARILGVALNKLKQSHSNKYYNGYYGEEKKCKKKKKASISYN
jgi:polysaccharide biosynthesis transport protein